MDTTDPDRNWDVSKIEMAHNYWIDEGGKYINTRIFKYHLNPRLVWKTLRSKSIKNVILAVSYHDPNIVAIILCKRLHLTSKRIFFWAEANYLNRFRRDFKLKTLLRKFVFSSVDGAMIIPGKMSEITFEKWKIPVKKFIYLPNTINDSGLVYEHENIRGKNFSPVFLLPIRLVERIKGALNFFEAIGEENIRKSIFMIAGNGQDQTLYERYIKENRYEEHIILKGFCESNALARLYNSCNVLLLPSFTDSSPLCLVEGLFFHLPILCSNHCGNHFETVKEGKNGYTFSPYDREEIKQKYELLLSNKDNWPKMGEVSADIYKNSFTTDMAVNRFVTQFSAFSK